MQEVKPAAARCGRLALGAHRTALPLNCAKMTAEPLACLTRKVRYNPIEAGVLADRASLASFVEYADCCPDIDVLVLGGQERKAKCLINVTRCIWNDRTIQQSDAVPIQERVPLLSKIETWINCTWSAALRRSETRTGGRQVDSYWYGIDINKHPITAQS